MKFLGMELFPTLTIDWWNGWILLVILYIVELMLVLSFPKNRRGRLFEYDHSRWSKRHRALFVIGKSLSLICLLLIAFAPLKMDEPVFFLGLFIYTIGLVGFTIALVNFRNTPLDQPVTRGFYSISRNPQVLTLFIIVLGICLTIGSWIAVFVQFLSAIFNRVRLLEEEKACLENYGGNYQVYMKRVPRYLLIKTRLKESDDMNNHH